VSKEHRYSGATVWMLILLAAVSGGCGGGMSKSVPPPPPPPPGGSEFLFVTAQNAILGFTVDPTTGMLNNPTKTPSPSSSTGIVALPKQGVLYVSDPQHNQVDGFAINKSTGALTLLPGSPFSLPSSGGSPGSMAVDPEGKFLFVSNSTNTYGNTDVLAIDNSSGNLTAVPGSPFVDADQGFATVFPSSKYLFSVSGANAASAIVAEAIDPNTGTSTPVPGSPFSTMGIAVGCGLYPCSPISLAVNSAGTLFVVAYSGFQTYRTVFPASVDAATGSLTLPTIQNALFQFGEDNSFGGADFAVATLGNYAYVADIYGIHAINFAPADGTPTEVKGSPFAPGTANGGLVITADGKFLYAASSSANTITIISIDASTGALSPVGNPVAAASGPLMLTLYKP
jgi:6-phosphogluconolactonase